MGERLQYGAEFVIADCQDADIYDWLTRQLHQLVPRSMLRYLGSKILVLSHFLETSDLHNGLDLNYNFKRNQLAGNELAAAKLPSTQSIPPSLILVVRTASSDGWT